MSESNFYDYLIVGQGLAGSLLAWRLIHEGKKVLVLDDAHATSSSMVAAGVINPLAGKRFNHAPKIHAWLDSVEATYTELSEVAGKPFLQWVDMLRLFREQEQYRYHARLPGRKDIQDLLGASFPPGKPPQPVNAPLGGFTQHRTGYVRLPALLKFLANWLREQDALQLGALDHDSLKITDGQVAHGNIEAKGVIFCDGYRSMDSPWFGYLPFAPDQGEILTLQAKPGAGADELPRMIINGGVWLLPIDGKRFRLGSTHNHDTQDNRPSKAGAAQLLESMRALLDHPDRLELLCSEAGVRPATSDRQPFLGTHPVHPELHIFNGFGAHGSLMIPWHSERMLDWLLAEKPLPETSDITRFN
ncbi:NAD(P)/FAD-dependent oxidoreductase [Thiolapillus sp.]